MRKGFTILELIIAVALMVTMFLVMAGIFQIVLKSWSSQDVRSGVDSSIETTVRKLTTVDTDRSASPVLRMGIRDAVAISDRGGRDEIRVAVKQRDASGNQIPNAQGNPMLSYYVYYLYNSANSYPPSFNQSSYDLKRAPLTGATATTLDSGTFTYGAGDVIQAGVLPPPASDLSVSNNVATIDLSAKSGDETVRTRTKIKPRN